MGVLGLLRGGDEPGSDRPDGLVSDDNVAAEITSKKGDKSAASPAKSIVV